jgi:hypothetical protein
MTITVMRRSIINHEFTCGTMRNAWTTVTQQTKLDQHYDT